jgi:hypothetical protein
MAVWTCVNQEGYERFPFVYGTECTHKTVQTTTNTVKQIFVSFSSFASPNTIPCHLRTRNKTMFCGSSASEFFLKIIFSYFSHVLEAWKHFKFRYLDWDVFNVPMGRAMHTVRTDGVWSQICVLFRRWKQQRTRLFTYSITPLSMRNATFCFKI